MTNLDATIDKGGLLAPSQVSILKGDDLCYRWVDRHNRAVLAYANANVGAVNDGTEDERGILTLADAIARLVADWEVLAETDWLLAATTGELLRQFRALLNWDLGRLNAGTLSDWASTTLARIGLDPDDYA